MVRPILLATLVAGTLDILAAVILTLAFGRAPASMLRYVASGPFPGATEWAASGALLGLIVHFALMGIMATAFVTAAQRLPSLTANPIRWGAIYGLITYIAMNLIVVPLRFPAAFPPKPLSIVTQLFCHVMLVGIPIALITARRFRSAPPAVA